MVVMIALLGLIISLLAFAGIYFMSLQDVDSDDKKKRVQNNADYDGMGTYSRYINK
jgi:Tfp pilus assembly protein PilV